MITRLKKYSRYFFLLAFLPACSKQKGFGPNYSDYITASVPITIANSVGYRPDPTVTCSIGGDSSITITLNVAPSSKHTIKEVTRVATSSSYTPIQSTGTTGFYNYSVAVNPGSGSSVTFKTTLGEYLTNNPKDKPNVKLNVELPNRFYFRLTIDDGSIVYPTPARVLIVN
ncbi:MAG TPA: hypothetical protein VN824_16210 [Puia sp.]|nr:hypothetical protein [Puia sp.]